MIQIDMPMPETCEECRFSILQNDDVYCTAMTDTTLLYEDDWPQKRVDRCPLVLQKEPEAKPQRYKESDIFHIPICPNPRCNAVMNKYWHYCPYCRTKFAWDEELDKMELTIANEVVTRMTNQKDDGYEDRS